MNEKKRSQANPLPTEPLPEFVQEVIQAYPRLRSFTVGANRIWQRVAGVFGVAVPSEKPKVPTYYHISQPPKPQVKSAAEAQRPMPSVEDTLVAEANTLISRYTQCGSDNVTEKASIHAAIAVFEKKYYTVDLKTLSFDALVLYEQVMLISMEQTPMQA